MKNYVVAIISFFENDIKQFKISADDEYQALKKALVDFHSDEESKKYEIDYQNSIDYPKTIKDLESYLNNGDMSSNVIEI